MQRLFTLLEEEQVSPGLGSKIRNLRRERGLTITEVAEKSGLAVSMVSQVERDIVTPSISSLRKIAGVLNVPAFYFLIEEADLDGRVVRLGERRTLKLPDHQAIYQLLSPSLDKRIEMIFFELSPGEATCEAPMGHEGEENLTVTSGRMKIVMPDREEILEAGDSIYIDRLMPHQAINIGDRPASAFCAITPPSF